MTESQGGRHKDREWEGNAKGERNTRKQEKITASFTTVSKSDEAVRPAGSLTFQQA